MMGDPQDAIVDSMREDVDENTIGNSEVPVDPYVGKKRKISTILLIFGIIIVGVYFSPTITEMKYSRNDYSNSPSVENCQNSRSCIIEQDTTSLARQVFGNSSPKKYGKHYIENNRKVQNKFLAIGSSQLDLLRDAILILLAIYLVFILFKKIIS